eukprot:TRINITY_DN7522_c0_g3_i3.p1 TRINITY_DN7522_c0_g3~~TRINITY_DN7522_c0_g3_i3.p1  ORF type:complete len:344 (-),score=46.10 TRINITY_DN7522_c0_g3_i3:246-1277(-)
MFKQSFVKFKFCFIVYAINLSSGQTLGVKAQRFRGHTSPHRNVKEKKNLEQMTPTDLTLVAWCCATGRFDAYDLLVQICNKSLKTIQNSEKKNENINLNFDSSNLARLVWSVGMCNHSDMGLFFAVQNVIINQQIKLKSSVDVVNILVGCAKTKFRDHQLLKFLSEQIQNDFFDKLKPNEAARATWVFAKLNYPDKQCLNKVLSNLNFEKCSAQDVSNLMYAFAELRFFNQGFVNKLIQRAEQCVHQFRPQELANFVRGLGQFGSPSPSPKPQICNNLLDQIKIRVLQEKNLFNDRDLSMICWGFYRLGRKDVREISEKYLQELDNETKRKPKQGKNIVVKQN